MREKQSEGEEGPAEKSPARRGNGTGLSDPAASVASGPTFKRIARPPERSKSSGLSRLRRSVC